jgi:hypothetical protein
MSPSTATARVPARPIIRPVGRERPQPPRLRVVAPTTHRSATGLALVCVALLGGGLLVLLLLNISIGKGAYTLTRLEGQQRQLAEQQQSLSERVDAAGAPQKLAATARKLGMVPEPNAAFVRVPDGRVVGTPAIATAPPKPTPAPKLAATAKTAVKKAVGTTATAEKATGKTPVKAGATGKAGVTGKAGKPKAPATTKVTAKAKQPAGSKR